MRSAAMDERLILSRLKNAKLSPEEQARDMTVRAWGLVFRVLYFNSTPMTPKYIHPQVREPISLFNLMYPWGRGRGSGSEEGFGVWRFKVLVRVLGTLLGDQKRHWAWQN